MLEPITRLPPNQPVVIPVTIPGPFGGWNTRDSVAAMPPTDAVLVQNVICYPGEVKMRRGSSDHATGFPSGKEVESLMDYNPQGTSGAKLFAATNTAFYDVTTPGAIGASVVTTTNGKWQHVNFTNSAGSWLIAVNGVDNMQQWNGTVWASVANLSGSFPTTTIIGITIFKQRLIFVPKDELSFWYLPTGAVTGTALRFNLGQICRRGGRVMAALAWTIDGGNGSDDQLVLITTEGEVIVYAGDDPSNPLLWSLVGVYYIGRPLGRRCLAKYGGDVLALTDRGAFPISRALQSSTVDKSTAFTDKIEPTFVTQALSLFSVFGWETVVNTAESYLLMNVPNASGSQYVMQQQSGGWSEFIGWDANCFAFFNGQLYFGSFEKVKLASAGTADGASAITANIVPAFNYLGTKGQKQIDLLRPIFSSNGPFSYTIGLSTDFNVTEPSTSVTGTSSLVLALWDSAVWDQGLWAGNALITKSWRTVNNFPFYAAAPYIRISSASVNVSLVAVDFLATPCNSFL